MSKVSERFKLVIGTHDLALSPVADGDELNCWMPFPAFRALFADLERNTSRTGIPLEITSDDAFISDYELLLPWLLESGRKATFFIPTAFLNRPGRLTPSHLREMRRLGMNIGTHGIRHVNWAKLDDAEMREDILGGMAALEDILGERITLAAPPFGGYDHRVTTLLRDNGITEIHTCDGGYAVTAGSLRTRMAVAQDSMSNLAILELSKRRPGLRDQWRGRWHELKDSPNLPWRRSGGQRLAASARAAS